MSLRQEVDRILRDLENPEGAGVLVTFDERPHYNEDESNKQGRPVFENRLFITKHKDNLSVNISRATDEDIANYPRQYETFKRVHKEREQGIPVGMLPGITPAQRATCEACRIFTVEKLSEADESVMAAIRMPQLKQRAIEYLQKGDKMRQMQDEIASLKKQLKGNTDEPVNNGPKRRGRKPAIRATDGNYKQQQQGSAAAS